MTLDYAKALARMLPIKFPRESISVDDVSFIIRSFYELCIEEKNAQRVQLDDNTRESGRLAVRVGRKADQYCLYARIGHNPMTLIATFHHSHVVASEMECILMQLTLEFTP